MNPLLALMLPLFLLGMGVVAIASSLKRNPPVGVGRTPGGAGDGGEASGSSAPAPVAQDRYQAAWTGPQLWALFASKGARWNVPPVLLSAIARTESNYLPRARGNAGEIGMMQVMPSTGKVLLAREGFDPPDVELLKFPEVAVDAAARLLDELWRNLELGGARSDPAAWELAVHAYNLGEPRVMRGQRNDVYAGRVYDAIADSDWAGLEAVDRVTV